MNIQPQGDDLRKAVKWISEERDSEPGRDLARLAGEASLKFDLSPKDADFLLRFVREKE